MTKKTPRKAKSLSKITDITEKISPTIVSISEALKCTLEQRAFRNRLTPEELAAVDADHQLRDQGGNLSQEERLDLSARLVHLPPSLTATMSVCSRGIVYQTEDLGLLPQHLTVLDYYVKRIGGDDRPSVFGVSLDGDRALVYWTSSAENDIATAVTLANQELSRKNLPPIPPVNQTNET